MSEMNTTLDSQNKVVSKAESNILTPEKLQSAGEDKNKLEELLLGSKIDLNNQQDLDAVKKYLQLIAKKSGDTTLAGEDISYNLASSERRLLNKIIELAKAKDNLSNLEKAIYGFSKEELLVLNNLMQGKVTILEKTKQNTVELHSEKSFEGILKANGESKVLETLCDFNFDGKIDAQDKNEFNGDEMLKTLQKYPQSIAHMAALVGENFTDTKGLYDALLKKPQLAQEIRTQLFFLAHAGVNPTVVLAYGEKGIKASGEKLGQLKNAQDKLTQAIVEGFSKKLDVVIADLEQKISTVTDEATKKELQNVIVELKKNESKQSFFDKIKVQGAALAISLVENNKWFSAGASLSNEQIDDFVKQKSASIIDGMQLNIGLSEKTGQFYPGIGVNFSSKEFQIQENTQWNFNTGLFLTVPYVAGTVTHTYNSEALKKEWFSDFSAEEKRLGATANFSTLANGVTLHWSKEQLPAVEKKEQQLKTLLQDIFDGKNPDMSALSAKDKENIAAFQNRAENLLTMIGKDNTLAKQGLVNAMVEQWKKWIYQHIQEKWLQLTGLGLGVQFIAGFVPLPTLWARVTTSEVVYSKNSNLASIHAKTAPNSLGNTQPTQVDNGEVTKEMFTYKDAKVQAYLEKSLSKFDGSNGASPIAMRNPKDYPKFLEAVKVGDTNKAALQLIQMLKTDPILKHDSATRDILKTFHNANLTDINKAYIVAQFMDVIFKDKNSIYTVLSSDTEWKKREGGLNKLYSPELAPKILELRNTVRDNVLWNAKPEEMNSLLGFVASYKIGWENGKAISLGRWEAAIPPGLATVVGGERWVISVNDQPQLVDHVIDKLKGTPYYANIQASFGNILKTQLDDATFVSLLKDGKATIGGKEVTLNRDFVFFLYGRCANETLGLNIKSFTIGNNEPVSIAIDPSGMMVVNAVDMKVRNYAVGVIPTGKENPSWENQKPVTSSNPGGSSQQDVVPATVNGNE